MGDSQNRVEELFLRRGSCGVPGYPEGRGSFPRKSDREYMAKLPTPSRTCSNSSASPSIAVSRYSDNDTSSRGSSVTAPSSLSSSPQQPQAMLNQQIAMAPYTLPCIHASDPDCSAEFHPAHFQYWIEHSLSHFQGLPPPPKSMCIFCDYPTFKSKGNAYEAWERRMIHIQNHLQHLVPREKARPDFLVIDYLHQNRLVSEPDFKHAIKYTERPYVEGLVPNDFETPEMSLEKERRVREPDDLEKERRQMRKERERHKGKGTEPSKPSKPSKPSHKSRDPPQVRNER